jgi:hypothetical protein
VVIFFPKSIKFDILSARINRSMISIDELWRYL